MLRFRKMKSLQKFVSVLASLHNHFALERHLADRHAFKQHGATAWAGWRSLAF